MTNFEHMSEEEKKLAIINGLYRTKEGNVKPCPYWHCGNCDCDNCHDSVLGTDIKDWLDSEYEPPKTKNERFCETLKIGEVIAVSDADDKVMNTLTYNRFTKYDADKDRIVTGIFNWKHGRKLTAEERGGY